MAKTAQPLTKQVAELLLLSKSMLDKIRVQVAGNPDRHSLAIQILITHDAAELALFAIATHKNALPRKKKDRLLLGYLESIPSQHKDREMSGTGYFDQLNGARNNLKHNGVFPEPNQWAQVGGTVYGYVSDWCSEYLGFKLDELDESILLEDKEAKSSYDEAKELFEKRAYKQTMEKLALALFGLFLKSKNTALSYLTVGSPKAEDAIRVASFGVQANDFLRLQEFLPQVVLLRDKQFETQWLQGQYGHPGNWREDTARFCLKVFLDVAIKIQSAQWIPGPIHFSILYEHKIEALKDKVEIWNLPEDASGFFVAPPLNPPTRRVETILSKGDVLRGQVYPPKKPGLFESVLGQAKENKSLLVVSSEPKQISGYVASEDVRVTCVPRNNNLVRDLFTDLPEIEWEDSES